MTRTFTVTFDKRKMKLKGTWLAGLGVLLIFSIGATTLPGNRLSAKTAPDRAAELELMHAACVDAMVRSTCKVMAGPAASSASTVVFIAGIGPVDAAAYRELRASGDAMCGTIRAACTAEWESGQCRTARGLFGSATPPR